jgi:CAAX amino terminal protease family.
MLQIEKKKGNCFNMENLKKLPFWKSLVLFALPSAYFIMMTRWFTPLLHESFGFNPYLSWYITGCFVFVPLFMAAVLLVKRETGSCSLQMLFSRLRFKKLTKSDFKWTIGATFLSFIAMGVIFCIAGVLTKYFSVPALQTTPDFMRAKPLVGFEKLYLLIWLPMFFFNIVGEQMLWHGYILPRQELTHGKWACLVNSICWLLFHICFGIGLMILLLPLLIIIPYTIQKTKNTTTGLIIHAIVNGPMAVVVALGLIH